MAFAAGLVLVLRSRAATPRQTRKDSVRDTGTIFNNLIDIIAKKLEMSLAGVGFFVDRGESIAKNGEYLLID